MALSGLRRREGGVRGARWVGEVGRKIGGEWVGFREGMERVWGPV